MPVVSDFIHIVGDQNIRIGDGENESGYYTDTFNTGGRNSNSNAFITFMIKGMTGTNDNADVFVNDVKVGALFNNNGGNRNHWQTQTVSLSGSGLKNGNNVLRVSPVTNTGNQNDDFDNYFIRNVICHFHQSA